MLLKRALTAVCFVLLISGACAWAATEVITYDYNDSLEILRTDYDGTYVVDYTYDGVGNRLTRTISTGGIPANNAPSAPAAAFPANAATDVSAIPTLSWAGTDPDTGDVVSYDVYLGIETSPPLYIKGTTAASIALTQRLMPMTTYYWKVVVRDNHNAQTQRTVWSFTTGNEAPTTPQAVLPAVGTAVDFNNVYLSWTATDPDIGDALTYDIYFGDSATPPLVQSDSSNQI